MSYNTPVRHLQDGSVLEATASGTVLVSSGGSVQVASGGVIQIASGGSIVNAGAQSFSGVQSIASGGTLLIASGGSIQAASGGVISVAAGGSVTGAGQLNMSGSVIGGEVATAGTLTGAFLSLGGTVGKWAFGTATMTAGGSVIINTGLTTVRAANGNAIAPLAAVNGAAGTYFVQVDATRFANGSIMLLSVANGTVTPGGGTVAWSAFGL